MSSLEGDIQKIEDVDSDEIQVGDLFIGTNAAGKKTCLMVADLCQDDLTGERLMLLVQGGAPAQQAHIVADTARGCAAQPVVSVQFQQRDENAGRDGEGGEPLSVQVPDAGGRIKRRNGKGEAEAVSLRETAR